MDGSEEARGDGGPLLGGASQAGLQLAVSLRELGDTGTITLVGAEVHPPYQRPPLSKEYLSGTADGNTLAFRAPSFYADQAIDLVCGEKVEQVAMRPDGSGCARSSGGQDLRFDRLA